jgi:hypothetical protein
VQHALEYVAHPSLIPDFADEIIAALVRHADDDTLALSYFHTVQPIIKNPHTVELLFSAMARTSLSQALHYSRTYPDHTRELLFQQLISSVLDAPAGEDTAERAAELISLPLDSIEDQWFEEFLSHGDGRALKKAKDTLLMRRIATGRYEEAVGERVTNARWGTIIEGLKSGLGGRS